MWLWMKFDKYDIPFGYSHRCCFYPSQLVQTTQDYMTGDQLTAQIEVDLGKHA